MYVAGTALIMCSHFGLFSSSTSPSTWRSTGIPGDGNGNSNGDGRSDGGMRGISIDNYHTTLPLKKGLSSSAAVCVLVVQAFGIVYGLDLNVHQVWRTVESGKLHCGYTVGRSVLEMGMLFGQGLCCGQTDRESQSKLSLRGGVGQRGWFADCLP